jgi:hypothetical protein
MFGYAVDVIFNRGWGFTCEVINLNEAFFLLQFRLLSFRCLFGDNIGLKCRNLGFQLIKLRTLLLVIFLHTTNLF